ncbi:unnamed protein product [Ostreobium quekettii]|uniref:Uncharacterized protein n=1 Tax=Ostreobium quekettii TaxID=121088 RepID=A0A8S1J2B9_9CHLO|nr:unnamed protein product [Ostreobium quekettii]|eukprot:evm.model.scf_1567.1 EVM.evm.TU.scf_1567.1   scf_1567:25065-34326(+)
MRPQWAQWALAYLWRQSLHHRCLPSLADCAPLPWRRATAPAHPAALPSCHGSQLHAVASPADDDAPAAGGERQPHECTARVIEDGEHPISYRAFSRAAWRVVMGIRQKGHEAYIVGGTIRDLLLQQEPKDYDILTSAEPKEVCRIFARANIIGKRFPICQVHMDGTVIEVSSFSTNVGVAPVDPAGFLADEQDRKRANSSTGRATEGWRDARRRNALSRDFTVNAFLYDPCSQLLFDYCDGLQDIKDRQLRTVGDPDESFSQDPARMLRAVRFAARVGLSIAEDTAKALMKRAADILCIPEARLQMEMHAILAHGHAARSVQIMWHLGVLDVVLPALARHLKRCNYPRSLDTCEGTMAVQILAAMDAEVTVRSPVVPSVYTALIACTLVMDNINLVKKKMKRLSHEELHGPHPKEGQVDPEVRRLRVLAAQPEASVFAHLVDATLRSLCTLGGYQVIPKAVQEQASRILTKSARGPEDNSGGPLDLDGIDSWDKPKRRKKVVKGEKLVASILAMEEWKWRESTNIGLPTDGLTVEATSARGSPRSSK